ncbi:MAG: ABC transporter permease [Clostridia bacterium]|nr:ABC transporter permease [Clostridia bacterium]
MKIKNTFMNLIGNNDPASKFNRKKMLTTLSPVIGLVALFILASSLSNVFLTASNLTNVLRQVSVLGFAALGMTIVIITGNIDLSIIGNVSMSTTLVAVLLQNGWDVVPMILVVLLASSTIGLLNGLIISYFKIESFVITMGMQVVCFGLSLFIAGGRTVIVDNLAPFMLNLASNKLGMIPVMFIILLGFYTVFYIFTKKTKMGRYIYALGGNEEVSYVSGVNVTIVRTTAYILSGLMAGVAGIFTFSRSLCGDPAAGSALGMYVVAAVVIGGTKMSGGRGSVLFTIIGILIIGIINNTLNLVGFEYYAQQIIQGLIIIFAVVISSKKRR